MTLLQSPRVGLLQWFQNLSTIADNKSSSCVGGSTVTDPLKLQFFQWAIIVAIIVGALWLSL